MQIWVFRRFGSRPVLGVKILKTEVHPIVFVVCRPSDLSFSLCCLDVEMSSTVGPTRFHRRRLRFPLPSDGW
ncbi:unnamed protein product, partial [Linum tenue]